MAEIKIYARPKSLYRYRAVANEEAINRELEAIGIGYLWCSDFRSMNDPMEGIYHADQDLLNDDQFDQIRRTIFYEKFGVGICSLSETGMSDLMWAHYANQFSGICIEYDFNLLLEHLAFNVDFVRVQYDNQILRVAQNNIFMNENYHFDPNFVAKLILSYKKMDWRYEREWRVFGPMGQVNYGRVNCVRRVIVGPRMEQENKNIFLRSLNELDVPVSEITIEGYNLTIHHHQ